MHNGFPNLKKNKCIFYLLMLRTIKIIWKINCKILNKAIAIARSPLDIIMPLSVDYITKNIELVNCDFVPK